jgi:hypothetical protein
MQEYGETLLVKDKIIPNMPYSHYNGTNTHSNICLLRFNNTIKPIFKHIRNTQGRRYIERHVNNLPNYFCKRAIDKKMLYRLIMITKAALYGTLPISFQEIILSKDFLS